MRMHLESDYLHLPVRVGAPMRRLRVALGGEVVREFDIELAEGEPDFYAFMDVRAFRAQEAVITAEGLPSDSPMLAAVAQADDVPGVEALYREPLRPQFHFSSRRGWNNDPNGLLYYAGKYHLFYQHNPYGTRWGNMHWGHAVSPDLVHWHELPIALYPDELGTMYSGSGVVDWHNTTGFGAGDEPPLVLIYTAAGDPFTQCLAHSNDRGRTWRKYEGNPVLGHIAGRNRDPKVIWHEPTRRWIMALFLDGHEYALLASEDLKAWQILQRLELGSGRECPDLFPLAVEGDPAEVRWVLWGADGSYVLGRFDGHGFRAESEGLRYWWGGDAYAAQTWSDVPPEDGRRIQIAWLRVELPGAPFGQCMAFPCELSLRKTPRGLRLCSRPVREIERLHLTTRSWEDLTIREGEDPLEGMEGELLHLSAEFAVGDATEYGITARGVSVTYDAVGRRLLCLGREAPLDPVNGCIRLEILVDRASVEIYANDGLVALPLGVVLSAGERRVGVFSRGGSTTARSLAVHELRPAWERPDAAPEGALHHGR